MTISLPIPVLYKGEVIKPRSKLVTTPKDMQSMYKFLEVGC